MVDLDAKIQVFFKPYSFEVLKMTITPHFFAISCFFDSLLYNFLRNRSRTCASIGDRVRPNGGQWRQRSRRCSH